MAQTVLSLWGIKKPASEQQFTEKVPTPPTPPHTQSMMVSLKVQPEKLVSIKPKTHSFFQKRKYHSQNQNKAAKKPAQFYASAPWPKSHVLLQDSPVTEKLARRLKSSSFRVIGDRYNVYSHVLRPIIGNRRVREPKRRLFTEQSLGDLVQENKGKLMNYLNQQMLLKDAFDRGTYEHAMWTDKYAPKSPELHFNPKQATRIQKWLKTQFSELRNRPQNAVFGRSRKTSLDGFEVPDDDKAHIKPFLVCIGPHGAGKTSAVYCACNSLKGFVLESNATVKRTGIHVRELLSGITQSHAVHGATSRQNCVVLFEEIDTLDEEDANFWPTLRDFARNTKRPIILTCNSADNLPASLINDDTSSFIYLDAPHVVFAVDICWHIALCEGHLLDRSQVAKVVLIHQGDIRKSLTHLQFWCQMGVGGQLAAVEWLAKQHEMKHYKRVVSENTFIEQPYVKTLGSEPESFARLLTESEQQSLQDASPSPLLENPIYLRNARRKSLPLYKIFDDNYEWPSESPEKLTLELYPYLRDVASSDLERMKIAYHHKRLSRRSLASFGIKRNFFKDPELILSTFPSVSDHDSEATETDSSQST